MASRYDKRFYWGSWGLCFCAVVMVVLYLINGGYTIETFGFYGVMFAMGARNIVDAKKERKQQLSATPSAPPQT